jgi:hypothetical protein
MALLDGTMEDPPNSKPAQQVAASNVTTKNDFLIMRKTPWKTRTFKTPGGWGTRAL